MVNIPNLSAGLTPGLLRCLLVDSPSMRIRKLTLQHFRNIPLAALELQGRQQFFIGANGQGKTNLLEAVGFLTALRSFRTTDAKLLIAHGQGEAGIACELEHEQRGETRVTVRIKSTGREVLCDQEPVTRLGDYLGKFPTVVFSSQDLQLLRGAPTGRRRWLDLTLAAIDPAYLKALQTYTRALADRNSLLKRGPGVSGKEIEAFEHIIAPVAAELIARRAAGLLEINTLVQTAYGRIADQAETTSLGYDPDFAGASAEMIREKLATNRARDAQFRTTLAGPHRDDIELRIANRAAKDFASEGQQRSLVLALRVAQAAWFQQKNQIRPVLLADDVLGELDPARRRRFWSAIDPQSQVIATGTTLPEAELGQWQVFEVAGGGFQPAGGAA